jgi:hypothetical protein
MSLTELQRAIEALPAEQQASLAAWLAERDRRQWDLELEQDFSPGGAGMALLDRVRSFRSFSLPATEGPDPV